MKNLLSFLWRALISAYGIGLLLTLGLTLVSLQYFIERSQDSHLERSFSTRFFEFLHTKSIDLKLLARGPRGPSPDIVILDIDDRSLEILGRWPWSRNVIVDLIDRSLSYNIKTLAFDVIFSEPQENELLKSIQKLSEPEIRDQLLTTLESDINDLDFDAKLRDSIERGQDKVILGSFFDYPTFSVPPWANACADSAFDQTAEGKHLEGQGLPFPIIDDLQVQLPEPVIDMINFELSEIVASTKKDYYGQLEKNGETKSSRLQSLILENQLKFCSELFSGSEKDLVGRKIESSWDQVKESLSEDNVDFKTWRTKLLSESLINPVTEVGRWWLNTEKISEKSLHTGYFNTIIDKDGPIRRAPIAVRYGSKYMMPIALKSFLLSKGYFASLIMDKNPKHPREKQVRDFLVMDEEGNEVFSIPVQSDGTLLINYAGPRKMFPYLPVSELLKDSDTAKISQRVFDPSTKIWTVQDFDIKKSEWLRDKLVILGPSATGIFDLRVTPFEENYPGVETHANVLDNLVRQDFLVPHPQDEPLTLLSVVVLGIIGTLIVGHFGALLGLIYTALLFVGLLWIDFQYFFLKGILFSISVPALSVLAIYMVLTVYKYFTEERAKKELKGTFAKYVSPSIVDEILSDPSKIELGGRKQNVTVFFSDVRGFTTISEKLDPRDLSDILNRYLTPMTNLVFEHKGTLDKYMGDAIMAFFGAPISFADHATHACRCALKHIEKLFELQKQFAAEGLPPIDIGIGLNTGDVSVGNMGSDTVRSYTVMGDAVNLASRLEGITKQYGVRIVISEFTHQRVRDQFTTRELDRVRVKGKNEPVRIYELICEGKPKDKAMQDWLDTYNRAFQLYYERDFLGAMPLFELANDSCSKLYMERCQDYLDSPPAPDWDGVYTMKTK